MATHQERRLEDTPSREQHRGNKLEYLYVTDSSIGLFTLLGSGVRALGKGWKTQFITGPQHFDVFLSLRNFVKMPESVKVRTFDKSHQIMSTESSDAELTLIDGSVHPSSVKPLRDRLLGRTHVMAVGEDPHVDDYDLISKFSATELHSSSVIAITGSGKGKSTTAYGIGLSEALRGHNVAIVQWFKERAGKKGTWHINEHAFSEKLHRPQQVIFYPTGLGFFGSPRWDRVSGEQAYQQHKKNAQRGVELVKKLLSSRAYKVIVLDEFVDTVVEIAQNIQYPLLELDDVQQLLDLSHAFPDTQVVVTGRRVTEHWSTYIQTSIVIEEIRHPWSAKGRPAVSGLDL